MKIVLPAFPIMTKSSRFSKMRVMKKGMIAVTSTRFILSRMNLIFLGQKKSLTKYSTAKKVAQMWSIPAMIAVTVSYSSSPVSGSPCQLCHICEIFLLFEFYIKLLKCWHDKSKCRDEDHSKTEKCHHLRNQSSQIQIICFKLVALGQVSHFLDILLGSKRKYEDDQNMNRQNPLPLFWFPPLPSFLSRWEFHCRKS